MKAGHIKFVLARDRISDSPKLTSANSFLPRSCFSMR
jgi:hypothetical protein